MSSAFATVNAQHRFGIIFLCLPVFAAALKDKPRIPLTSNALLSVAIFVNDWNRRTGAIPTMFGVFSARPELTMPSTYRDRAHVASGNCDRASRCRRLAYGGGFGPRILGLAV